MKKQAMDLLLVLTCVTLFAGGCAKREVVRIDQPLAPGANAAGIAKAEAVQAQQVKAESAVQQPAAPSPIQEQQAAQASVSEAGELAAALESIHFDFDSYTLSQQARDLLAANAQRLKQSQGPKVRVAGHCDERGSDDYNLALSERRAKSALQYLVALGVPAERLSVIGYGKEKPLAPGHDAASWAQNRRDDFEVLAQ